MYAYTGFDNTHTELFQKNTHTTSSHDFLCKEHRLATSATHVRGSVVARLPVVLLQQWCCLSHSVRRNIPTDNN